MSKLRIMRHTLFTLALMLLGSSCSFVQPEGNLKKLSDGELFSSGPSTPVPADNTAIPSRDETDVSWKLGGF